MRIGVDLGGTKIEAIALADDGAIAFRRRIDTPRAYRPTIEAIAALVAEADGAIGHRVPIGVGIPGTLSPATGLVKNANSTWLNGQALDRDLAAALGRQVRLANDANCFALSEASDGAGAGARIVFGVIIGTGCGGGIVVDGKILTGPHAVAGEWGHTPLPWMTPEEYPGPQCWCGKRGCIETFVSGTGLGRDHGHGLSAQEIVARADSGDVAASAALDRYVDRLGRGLAVIADILDPDAIVLGGGMSKLDRLYRDLPPAMARHVVGGGYQARILPPRHGDASGVRGAAWLWPISGP
ncbi:MAG: ROK family protein [Alphaproteobacteria bacterium]|nr:ROK family protein [Alphaproteobacteria bacterium]